MLLFAVFIAMVSLILQRDTCARTDPPTAGRPLAHGRPRRRSGLHNVLEKRLAE